MPQRPLVESLEGRRLLSTSLRVNFQPADVVPPDFFKADIGRAFATRGNGQRYGWDTDRSSQVFNRNNPDAEAIGEQFDTGISLGNTISEPATWEAQVPNGWYLVSVIAGDPTQPPGGRRYHFDLEGESFVDGSPSDLTDYVEGIMKVEVRDGRLTLTARDPSNRNVLNYIDISSTEPPVFREVSAVKWDTNVQDGPIDRIEAARVDTGDKVYVFGGLSNNYGTETFRTDVYDKTTNTWSQVTSHPEVSSHHQAVWDGGNFIYTLGGEFGRGPAGETVVKSVWRYDIAGDTWLLATDLPRPRGAHTAAFHDGYLYVTGGVDLDHTFARDDTWRLNLRTYGAWERLPDLPRKADHMTSIVAQGSWFLFGGEHGHSVSYVQHASAYRFDFDTLNFERLPDTPVAFSHAEGNIVEWRGEIFIAGGRLNGNERSDQLISYSPFRQRWTVHTSMPGPRFGGVSWIEDDEMIFYAGDFAGTSRSDTFRAYV